MTPSVKKPCIAVVNCGNSSSFSLDLIKGIAGREIDPSEGETIVEDIVGYPWFIETKYYTAEVCLCHLPTKTIGDADFAERIEAVVVGFNPVDVDCLKMVESWLPFIEEYNSDVRLLVCDRIHDDSLPATCAQVTDRLAAQQWCIANNFELIELHGDEDKDGDANEDDLEDDFKETVGIERVIQALHAHTWSNLVMIDQKCSFANGSLMFVKNDLADDRIMPNQERTVVANGPEENSCNETAQDGRPGNVMSSLLEGYEILSSLSADDSSDPGDLPQLGGDPNSVSFDELFQNFENLKLKANSLEGEERKAYAERVTMEFWKSIGGDPEEIQLSSDDDNDGG